MKVTTDYCRDLPVQLYVNEYRHLFDKGRYWGNHDGYWCVFKPCARFFWVILSPQGTMNMKHEEDKDEED